jgi:hypothetical protein
VARRVPTGVRVRSYNVGFGDCFLLTFSYPGGDERHALIDFGSTKPSPFGPDTLVPIAEQIKQDSSGKLQMVVATHRHADHISGFAGKPGRIIASLKPELVVQPWTEDPTLEPDARAPDGDGGGGRLSARMVVSHLSDLQRLAAAMLAEVPRLETSPIVPKTVTEQVRFLGETNLKNAAAVRNLMTMGKRPPVYASFGSKLRVGTLLPGVAIDVLGPPTLRQSEAIAKQRSRDPNEFWQLVGGLRLGGRTAAAGRSPRPIFPGAAMARRPPQEARWLIPQIDRMRAEEMLAIVRILDSVLNNTSLILLFHVGETSLLFPGDAQIENWSYALFTARNRQAIRKRLAAARFYKVGHHGSLNATPKTLWNAFEHRSATAKPDRLITMVSTLKGKHGSEARGTEVPRRKLITELKQLSDFHDTEALKSKKQFWNDVELRL